MPSALGIRLLLDENHIARLQNVRLLVGLETFAVDDMPHGPFHVLKRDCTCFPVFRKSAGDCALRLDTYGNFLIFGSKNDSEFPFRHIAQLVNLAKRHTPVSRNVDLRNRPAVSAQRIVADQTILQRLTGVELQFRIECRANGQATLIQRVLAIA